jgi:hypothetical protein
VLVALLHAIPTQDRRDKSSDGCTKKGESAKRKKQEGKKAKTAKAEIFRETHVVDVDQNRGEHEDIRGYSG